MGGGAVRRRHGSLQQKSSGSSIETAIFFPPSLFLFLSSRPFSHGLFSSTAIFSSSSFLFFFLLTPAGELPTLPVFFFFSFRRSPRYNRNKAPKEQEGRMKRNT